MAPTPMPRGYPGSLVRPTTPPLEEHEAIAEIESGLLVLSVLGMHTQDYSSGNYPLVAPQARVIKGGQLGGQVKAVLAGNFFDNLKDPNTRFVAVPHELNPGAVVRCAITVEI